MYKEIVALTSELKKNYGEIIAIDIINEQVFAANILLDLQLFLIGFAFLFIIPSITLLKRKFK
ncbi:MAG: hypothetical protein JXA60_04850 [Candidatus Coatesbacteria bacterium]|nr:hypothetical protein [Candidatus Coatesbacteria bacterium]